MSRTTIATSAGTIIAFVLSFFIGITGLATLALTLLGIAALLFIVLMVVEVREFNVIRRSHEATLAERWERFGY